MYMVWGIMLSVLLSSSSLIVIIIIVVGYIINERIPFPNPPSQKPVPIPDCSPRLRHYHKLTRRTSR
ncbi:hypothetical protein VTJ04DRAFT_5055 [Mycothermus thermophilus]|uniref:uncharacterized protein n=1 Tax=Humicola insolens TaxID=85995 RepID=UPI0037433852